MIPAPFDYLAPRTLDEALRALADGGEDVKVLAGGQSLLPVLRLRMAAPSLLIDLGHIDELRGVREDQDSLTIGAMTTHYDIVRDPLVDAHTQLIALTTATVADAQIRHRGTFGGSLAHADPAGDLGAAVTALDGEMMIVGMDGERTVLASEFFVDLFTTALAPGELLVGVRIPKFTGWGAHYEKFQRTAQAWSIIGVAAAVRMDNGTIAEARVGLANFGPTPVRARAVEQALVGGPATSEAIKAAAAHVADGVDPIVDGNADANYRRHLATVLTGRALVSAASMG